MKERRLKDGDEGARDGKEDDRNEMPCLTRGSELVSISLSTTTESKRGDKSD